MLGQVVKKEVEGFYSRARETNSLYTKARSGTLSKDAIVGYLINARYLVMHTPILLELARSRSLELGLNDLSAYYIEKIAEEVDHHKWADNDLNILGVNLELALRSHTIKPELLELVDYLRASISHSSVTYLGYIMFAEYLTVIGAPEFIENLQNHCGVPTQSMTILSNHVELDINHVSEGVSVMNSLVEPSKHEEILETVRTSMEIFDRLLAAMGNHH